jgi:hypothetical protein
MRLSSGQRFDGLDGPFGVTDDLAASFDQISIRRFARIFPLGVDVFVQGRFFKSLVGNTDAAKPTQTHRVHQMKRQLFIAEAKKNFDNGAAQYLICAHAVSALPVGNIFTPVQILKNTAELIFANSYRTKIALFQINKLGTICEGPDRRFPANIPRICRIIGWLS